MSLALPAYVSNLEASVRGALAEDLGSAGDHTARLTPDHPAQARVICREPAVICGRPWVDEVFRQLDPEIAIDWQVREGERVAADTMLFTLAGPARALLTGERSALNFLQTLSGTATTVAAYVAAVAGTGCAIADTRKTLPGLRNAQKYAVLMGGGVNHRIGLYDGILIKENHIIAAGSIKAVIEQAKSFAPSNVFIEVEVEDLTQLEEALDAGAKMILLDNMDLSQMREAVALNQGRAELEASGGVNLERVRAIAETGVDRISIGSLTKDVRAIDLSLRHVEE